MMDVYHIHSLVVLRCGAQRPSLYRCDERHTRRMSYAAAPRCRLVKLSASTGRVEKNEWCAGGNDGIGGSESRHMPEPAVYPEGITVIYLRRITHTIDLCLFLAAKV